jgi:hypothetical protein
LTAIFLFAGAFLFATFALFIAPCTARLTFPATFDATLAAVPTVLVTVVVTELTTPVFVLVVVVVVVFVVDVTVVLVFVFSPPPLQPASPKAITVTQSSNPIFRISAS